MSYLKKFQKENNLVADGIAGKNTLLKLKQVLKIPTNEATALFVAQVAHETGNFKYGEENLNYSSSALLRVFRKYFPTYESTEEYARNPKKIGSRVYANRMGNGPEHTNEGWEYRGRGAIQITGKNNYNSIADDLDCEILETPDLLITKYYFDCAIWYFNKHNLWRFCDKINVTNIKKITRAINGGYNGLNHRRELTFKYYRLLR